MRDHSCLSVQLAWGFSTPPSYWRDVAKTCGLSNHFWGFTFTKPFCCTIAFVRPKFALTAIFPDAKAHTSTYGNHHLHWYDMKVNCPPAVQCWWEIHPKTEKNIFIEKMWNKTICDSLQSFPHAHLTILNGQSSSYSAKSDFSDWIDQFPSRSNCLVKFSNWKILAFSTAGLQYSSPSRQVPNFY